MRSRARGCEPHGDNPIELAQMSSANYFKLVAGGTMGVDPAYSPDRLLPHTRNGSDGRSWHRGRRRGRGRGRRRHGETRRRSRRSRAVVRDHPYAVVHGRKAVELARGGRGGIGEGRRIGESVHQRARVARRGAVTRPRGRLGAHRGADDEIRRRIDRSEEFHELVRDGEDRVEIAVGVKGD